MKIYNQQSELITAPEGVEYTGSRALGLFLVLRFTHPVTLEYVDRYYNDQGVEIFRESGITPHPPTKPSFWSRLF